MMSRFGREVRRGQAVRHLVGNRLQAQHRTTRKRPLIYSFDTVHEVDKLPASDETELGNAGTQPNKG